MASEKHEDKHGHGHGSRLELVIRATNGAVWTTDDFKPNTKVRRVIKAALEHFIEEGAMGPGDYRLARVIDGETRPPLGEEDDLEEAGVRDGDVLVLIAREPQVDGCTPSWSKS